MDTNNFLAIITLSITASLLYILGFYFLFNPSKVRTIAFKSLSFFHRKGLEPFYQQRLSLMSKNWYLVFLRIGGVILILVGTLCFYLLLFKVADYA